MSRKQSREIVFRLLFAQNEPSETSFETACENEIPKGPELDFIKNLYSAVTKNLEEIDKTICNLSNDFPFDRIYKTDLTALRLGIGEIKYFNATPPVVALNEAVEIAKKYGSEKSGSFVNGILATVLKETSK